MKQWLEQEKHRAAKRLDGCRTWAQRRAPVPVTKKWLVWHNGEWWARLHERGCAGNTMFPLGRDLKEGDATEANERAKALRAAREDDFKVGGAFAGWAQWMLDESLERLLGMWSPFNIASLGVRLDRPDVIALGEVINFARRLVWRDIEGELEDERNVGRSSAKEREACANNATLLRESVEELIAAVNARWSPGVAADSSANGAKVISFAAAKAARRALRKDEVL